MGPTHVLVIWPPQVLSYFNAGHHSPLYSVAAYLRAAGSTVDVVDGSVERVTWKEIGDRLYRRRYDVIAVMNDLDGVDGLPRLIAYAREVSPGARIVTFGRLSGLRPRLFRQFDLDAIVETGDYEAGVRAFADANRGDGALPGVHVRAGDTWVDPAGRGPALQPEEWVLPDVSEIPYESYDWLYRDDQNKFCGIPGRRELIVPAARGCPIGCSYCEVPTVFGKADRRLPVARVLQYIQDSFAAYPFEYVSFYAPTFTLDRAWVAALCDEFIALGSPYPWKCATTMHHLDSELLMLMGRSGCIRVSVGVETLDETGLGSLPRVKQKHSADLADLAATCAAAGIELTCFVIVALPGTTPEAAEATVAEVRRLGARVRPTMFCPNDAFADDASVHEIGLYNRQLLVGADDLDRAARSRAYGIVFGAEPRPTQVTERIPQRVAP